MLLLLHRYSKATAPAPVSSDVSTSSQLLSPFHEMGQHGEESQQPPTFPSST
ncbi:hypothetical protein L195_g063838 [Trifolium pratense]|uniref:Uncharacterized protein n=1 Tax=Trifolium pratense TaxID=57577 RepID=A0A2K3KPA7_TRIPR|nr:hypothetical protein L195_g063838 [Trifolium pratense]